MITALKNRSIFKYTLLSIIFVFFCGSSHAHHAHNVLDHKYKLIAGVIFTAITLQQARTVYKQEMFDKYRKEALLNKQTISIKELKEKYRNEYSYAAFAAAYPRYLYNAWFGSAQFKQQHALFCTSVKALGLAFLGAAYVDYKNKVIPVVPPVVRPIEPSQNVQPVLPMPVVQIQPQPQLPQLPVQPIKPTLPQNIVSGDVISLPKLDNPLKINCGICMEDDQLFSYQFPCSHNSCCDVCLAKIFKKPEFETNPMTSDTAKIFIDGIIAQDQITYYGDRLFKQSYKVDQQGDISIDEQGEFILLASSALVTKLSELLNDVKCPSNKNEFVTFMNNNGLGLIFSQEALEQLHGIKFVNIEKKEFIPKCPECRHPLV